LPGTMARKGSSILARPHRRAHIIEAHLDGPRYTAEDLAPVLWALDCWQDEDGIWHLPSEAKASQAPEPQPSSNGTGTSGVADVIERARRYVAKMPPAIDGQKGHNALWEVAQVLIRGFGLAPIPFNWRS
jgi:hypothetical protein